MRRASDIILLIVEASSDWDDWDELEVTEKGEVKVVPKGRQPEVKKASTVILTDPLGEFSQYPLDDGGWEDWGEVDLTKLQAPDIKRSATVVIITDPPSDGYNSDPGLLDKTIPKRYELDSQALLGAVGCRHIIDVAGLIDVIEVKVEVRRGGEFFFQIILNPWAHLEAHPRVHILGVDLDAVEPLNEAEGRYFLNIEPNWKWSDDPNLVRFWDECVSPVINYPKLHSGLTFRSLPKTPGAYDLFFPSGTIDLAKKLEKHAKDNGWKLITKEESRIIEAQRQATAEAERIAHKTRLENISLEIVKAEDQDTLEEIRKKVEQDTSISEESPALIERIQARMSEVEPSRIDWDKQAKVSDPTIGHRKKETRVRRWPKGN